VKLNLAQAASRAKQGAVRRHKEPRFSAFERDGGRHHSFSDAHAYMLISSPTATSTIFGAFQVMLSSLILNPSFQTGVDFVSLFVLVPLSVARQKKDASAIDTRQSGRTLVTQHHRARYHHLDQVGAILDTCTSR
jgi:hypothetical protein